MRKLFLFAVLMLSMASCQTEPMGLDVVVGGEQDAIVTVSLSEGTRATSSAGFDFNNLEASGYDLRFILEITYGDTVVRKVETSKTTSMQFPVRLIAQRDYTFTVWADLVEKDTKDDLFYNTEKGLDEIEVILGEWTPNVEARDAYTYTMTKTFSATADLSMKLTRPFAKVRVVATDIDDVLDFNIEPTNAVVVYHTDMYTAFNAVEGKVIENQKRSVSHEFAYADVDTYTDIAGQRTLFADYILVPRVDNLQQCITLSYEALQGSDRIKLNNFNTPIPVETNKVTSIVGSMLTEGGNVNITINGELGEKETITFVDTAVDMQRVIDQIEEGESKNIRLGGNVTIGNTPSTSSTRAVARDYVYIAEGQTVIIDLNGYAISHSDVKNKYAFNNNGTLIIKDSKGGGSINARGIYNGYGEGAENVSAAKIIVESGSINAMGENGGAAIFNYGIAEIKGGKFKSNGGYGLNNQAGGEMTINGGEIIGGIYNLGTLSIDGENTSVYQHISGRHAIYNDAATATINNGSFDSESGNELILADGENSTVVINGGTFDKTAKSWLMGAATGKNITFTINGGTFRGYVNMPEQSVDTFRPYGDPIVVYGGTFNFDPTNFVALGYEAIEKDGSWTVRIAPVAKIGEVEYETFEAAVAAAKAGDTITLLKDVKPASLPVLKNITLKGNGQLIDYKIDGDNITIDGHVKVRLFNGSNYNRSFTVLAGGCLEVVGTDRISLGFNNTWNITGTIEDATSADKANIKPSLIIPGGISITGGYNAALNVTNAYVSFGNTSSKNSSANGVFSLNFTNSIVDFNDQFTFTEPTGGKTPTFNINFTNSVVTTAKKMCFAAPGCNTVVNNSILTLKNNFRNSGNFELLNGSEMTGSTIQFGENGGNNGAIIVNNSKLTINAPNTGSAFDGKGIGSITAKNGANVSVTYYKAMTITVDDNSSFTGTEVK